MKLLTTFITATVLVAAARGEDGMVNRPVGAFGRKFIHRDGTYTLSAKQGDKTTIVEETYTKRNIMIFKRVFQTDSLGRLRNGVIYDGRKTPMGSIYYGYDKKTDQIAEEQQYNKKGQLIRRVFYPGALRDVPGVDPRVVREGAAIVYNPDDPQAKPVQVQAPPPTAPVQSEQNEFTPGIPIGRAAQPVTGAASEVSAAMPTANPPGSAATPASAAATTPAAAPRKRSFFGKPR